MGDNFGKSPNPYSILTERVASTEILISPIGENQEGRNVDSQHIRVEEIVADVNPGKGSEFVENVQPNVKDTSFETSFKYAKSHSSVNPTVAEILDGLKKNAKGGRIKRALRKRAAPVRYKARNKNPSVKENVGKSTRVDQGSDDDDVVVVSSTASMRRTRASVIALEKMRVALGAGGEMGVSIEADEVMDLEELEKLMQKKRLLRKVRGRNKDKFIVDDLEDSGGEDAACIARRKSKGKMKINGDRNRINNRMIAKGIEEMSTEGVDFNSEENEARWNSVCARNIHPERYLSEATMKNQTYMDIIEESRMLVISDETGPHWPSMVRE
ncbi:hypothetical protein LIER_18050 [Lithospermum erythrorhizon]|uniref:Uncharacterized protein n=1 Tax=Lithospermum erythrorhizon TaxID=34254 RepID=A0AAV3QCS2_LITER